MNLSEFVSSGAIRSGDLVRMFGRIVNYPNHNGGDKEEIVYTSPFASKGSEPLLLLCFLDYEIEYFRATSVVRVIRMRFLNPETKTVSHAKIYGGGQFWGQPHKYVEIIKL